MNLFLGCASVVIRSHVDPSPLGHPPLASLLQLSSAQAALSVNAHAVFARACKLKSLICCSAAAASVENSRSSLWPTVANAHAVFASSCELKSLMRRSAAAASVENRPSSLWPTVANAHAVFARFYELKSVMRRSAAAVSVENRRSSL